MSNLRNLLCDSFLLLLGAGRICDGGSKLNTPGAGQSMILVLESNLRNLYEMPVVLVSAAMSKSSGNSLCNKKTENSPGEEASSKNSLRS